MSKLALNRRILIVGEGRETEYNYFVDFRNTFEEWFKTAAISIRVARGRGGDARGIVKTAVKEMSKFEPDRRRGDRVFLLLDTEGAGRAPELPGAEKLATDHGIEIVYSCPAFEYWLLCHFENASRAHFTDCAAVITELNKKWGSVCKTAYDKADDSVFRRLEKLLVVARAQALDVDLSHLRRSSDARRVNPSSQVYELVAVLNGAKSGEKCPMGGTWKLVGNPQVTVVLGKGDDMPLHNGAEAQWQL